MAPSAPLRNELRGIRWLEIGRWCKRRQLWVDVYLLRAARILLIVLRVCEVPKAFI